MEDAFNSLKDWYLRQPIFARSFLSFSVALSLMSSFHLVPTTFSFTFTQTFLHFNIWRPFTACAFFGGLDFWYIIHMIYVYMSISRAEEIFARSAYVDFAWFLIVLLGVLMFVSKLLTIPYYANSFVFTIMYVWCKRRPEERMRFFFGIEIKSAILPWCLIGLALIFGGSIKAILVGILLGHLYVFIKDIATAKYHKDFLPTPIFFKNWWYQYSRDVNVNRGPNPNINRGENMFGGQGYRLD